MAALLVLLAACAPVDADYDGASPPDDCDDADPAVYPGAPDTPGDGVDSDCADGDPPHPWFGDWTGTGLTAEYAGLSFFEAGTGGGTLALADDFTTTLTVTGTLNGEVIGTSVPVAINLVGVVSPVEGPDRFELYAEGDNYDELMHADWDCGLEAEVLVCGGELKALDIGLDAQATFAAM